MSDLSLTKMGNSSESSKLIATAKVENHSTPNAAPYVQHKAGKPTIVAVPRRGKRHRQSFKNLLAISPLFALAILLALLLGLPKPQTYDSVGFGCGSTGDPIVSEDRLRLSMLRWNYQGSSRVPEQKPLFWDARNTMVITMAFGAMPFSLAKLLDVAWDLIIGRGSQIASVYLIYYLYTGVFAGSMRHRPSPLDITLSVQYSTASPSAFRTHLRHLRTGSSSMPRRMYFAMLVLVAAIAYVLLLPTWLSAMTGYQPQMVPLLATADNTLVQFRNLHHCKYTIIDGSRVDLPNTTCVDTRDDLFAAVEACRTSIRHTYQIELILV